MRLHQSFFIASWLALVVAWGWTRPILSAQPVSTIRDSVVQAQQGQGSWIAAGARGLAYLFRAGQTPARRNLWQRRQHPESWQSTLKEREAAKAALPLVGAVALLALIGWAVLRAWRVWRAASARGRERPDRRTPVALAGSH